MCLFVRTYIVNVALFFRSVSKGACIAQRARICQLKVPAQRRLILLNLHVWLVTTPIISSISISISPKGRMMQVGVLSSFATTNSAIFIASLRQHHTTTQDYSLFLTVQSLLMLVLELRGVCWWNVWLCGIWMLIHLIGVHLWGRSWGALIKICHLKVGLLLLGGNRQRLLF